MWHWHGDEKVCFSCEHKLRQAPRELVAWFHELKARSHWVHVRDQIDRAVELFQIDEDGNDRFSKTFFKKVHQQNEADRLAITWNGDGWFLLK